MKQYSLLLLLALGHLIADMHQGGLPVLLPVLKETYALTYTQTASLMLWSQVTSSVIQPVFGVMSDRVSARWLLPTSLAVATVGLAVAGLATDYTVVVLGILTMGMGVASFHPEGSKLVHFLGGARKGQAMSLFALGGNIGLALGPLLMAVGLGIAGVRGTLLFIPVTLIVIVVIQKLMDQLYAGQNTGAVQTTAPASLDSPKPHKKDQRSFLSSISPATRRALLVLIAVIVLRSFAHTSFITFIPLYYTTLYGNPASYSSLLLTLFLITGALGTAFGGPASDRLGPRTIILWSFITSAPLFFIQPFLTTGIAPFIVAAVSGFTLIASFAVTTVLGQSLLPTRVGLASGLTLGFSVGTGGLGVTILGYVADHLGLAAAMICNALLLIVGVFVSLLLPKDQKRNSEATPSTD